MITIDKVMTGENCERRASGVFHRTSAALDRWALRVHLEGALWEINSLGRITTALWLPITNITVLKASQPVGEYRYTLVNKDDGENAMAKFLGKE